MGLRSDQAIPRGCARNSAWLGHPTVTVGRQDNGGGKVALPTNQTAWGCGSRCLWFRLHADATMISEPNFFSATDFFTATDFFYSNRIFFTATPLHTTTKFHDGFLGSRSTHGTRISCSQFRFLPAAEFLQPCQLPLQPVFLLPNFLIRIEFLQLPPVSIVLQGVHLKTK